MAEQRSINRVRFGGKGFLDSKTTVGTGYEFETIEDALAELGDTGLQDGMVINDADYGVSWQIYYDTTWKARLFDGQFHVKCAYVNSDGPPISVTSTPVGHMEGLNTADGVTVEEDDIVLIVSAYPNMNGIYIVHESIPWERHPIFDEAIDNIRAITIVVDEGTIYKNSQWRFSTIGAITPATLNSDYSMFVSGDSDTFISYTWLNFEMVGGDYPKTELTSGVSQVYAHNTLVLADATAGAVTVGRTIQHHIPNIEYKILKTDNSTNKVIYKVAASDAFDLHVLLEQGDWMEVINPTNNAQDSTDFIVFSNRTNKLLEPIAISADGKLSIDVPSGYRLWQIRGYASVLGTDYTLLNIGTSSGASDLAAAETYVNDGVMVVTDIDDNSITEVWVSDAGLGWLGNTITFELHIIKEG